MPRLSIKQLYKKLIKSSEIPIIERDDNERKFATHYLFKRTAIVYQRAYKI